MIRKLLEFVYSGLSFALRICFLFHLDFRSIRFLRWSFFPFEFSKYHSSSSQYLASQRLFRYLAEPKTKQMNWTERHHNNTNKYISIYDNWFEKRTAHAIIGMNDWERERASEWEGWRDVNYETEREQSHKCIDWNHINFTDFDLKGGLIKLALWAPMRFWMGALHK